MLLATRQSGSSKSDPIPHADRKCLGRVPLVCSKLGTLLCCRLRRGEGGREGGADEIAWLWKHAVPPCARRSLGYRLASSLSACDLCPEPRAAARNRTGRAGPNRRAARGNCAQLRELG